MSDSLPTVTILIAARPGQTEIRAVTAGRLLDYPREKLEMIVARGRQPSVQRNAALRAARGELIYFLDDDSAPPPGNLRAAVQWFADPAVTIAGGPNLCPPDAPLLEQVFALVHASWLAFFSSRARYAPVGRPRAAGEKELILCNLVGRRDALLAAGGFNEALYPNEENALMDELQKRGGTLWYDPALTVYRRPRHSLRAFCKMLLNYGRGRAEQVRLQPTPGSAPNFVPPLFLIYLGMTLFGSFYLRGITLELLLTPMAVYLMALLVQTACLIPTGGVLKSVLAAPLIFLTHALYGAGFWKGFFTPLKPAPETGKTAVELENVAL